MKKDLFVFIVNVNCFDNIKQFKQTNQLTKKYRKINRK